MQEPKRTDQQPEAAHAASEVDEPKHITYTEDDSIVLKFLLVILALASLLAAWASLEG